MAREAHTDLFRAEGALINWRQIAQLDPVRFLPPEVHDQRKRDLAGRAEEVQLRWSVADTLGVARKPFVVWARPMNDKLDTVPVEMSTTTDGHLLLELPEVAGAVSIRCTPVIASQAIGAYGLLDGADLHASVVARGTRSPGGGPVTLVLRGTAIERVLLVNGQSPTVQAEPLQQIIDDPGWSPIELVGLPVDGSFSFSDYSHDDQGLLSAPVPPAEAAEERLQRGRPVIGWRALTENGVFAPRWDPVDPPHMVHEVIQDLMGDVSQLFDGGLASIEQHQVVDTRTVAPPNQNGVPAPYDTVAELPPLGMLLLAGSSEPGLALATGFGTAYPIEPPVVTEIQNGETDFMVTADYDELPDGAPGAELAAYVPWPDHHHRTVDPSAIAVGPAPGKPPAYVAPISVDQPWRESIRTSWNRVEATAALGRPTGTAIARYDSTTLPRSECLLPKRDSGGFRTLLPMPDGPEGEPGYDRTAFVDAELALPLDGSARSVSYAVAAQDVFGVWSDWSDVAYTTSAPAPPTPRLISLDLQSSYAGSTTCPATVEIEFALDWTMRTPTAVLFSLGFFPMANADSDPPAALDHSGAPPSGTFRVNVQIPFTGDTPSDGPNHRVVSLDSSGENVILPGPAQGNGGRRYGVTVDVPTLDYGSTDRWGVRYWGRSWLAAIPGAGPWAPTRPALAIAASPVPIEPLPLPAPPGVPLGSTLDDQGRSHVKVRWVLASGASPSKIIVWEATETALQQRLGLTPLADGTAPGLRLAALRAAYDRLGPDARRSAFRRVVELDGSLRETDIALPKGSRDIHLFTVTTLSNTGVESPWPVGTAESRLQAVIGPKLVEPDSPQVRTTVGAGGAVTIDLEADSRIPVSEFRLYRTRSFDAARRFGSMGPPFATVTANAPPTGTPPDPATGELTYDATWSGTFAEGWRDWFIRAVAVPIDEQPVQGVRGRLSSPSEPVVLFVLPSGPPDLAPLVHDTFGADNVGVVVTTSTSAPVPPTTMGPHRLRIVVGSTTVAQQLDEIDEVASLTTPPAGVGSTPIVVRGARSGGVTPLAIWFSRTDAADPVDVAVHLADPRSRVATRTMTVPPYVPPTITLDITELFAIAGRGITVIFHSDAPIDARSAGRLTITATPGRGSILDPIRRPITADFDLHAVPTRRLGFVRRSAIDVMRTKDESPFVYAAFVAMTGDLTVKLGIVMGDGRTATAFRRHGRPLLPIPRDPIPFDPPPFEPRDPFRPR